MGESVGLLGCCFYRSGHSFLSSGWLRGGSPESDSFPVNIGVELLFVGALRLFGKSAGF